MPLPVRIPVFIETVICQIWKSTQECCMVLINKHVCNQLAFLTAFRDAGSMS